MKISKAIVVLLSLVLVISMLAGCTQKQDTPSTTGSTQSTTADTSGGPKYRIGVTFDNLKDFMSLVVDGANAYMADHPEVEVKIQDSNLDVAKQLNSVENFIEQGYDAILIKPVDVDACAPMYEKCKAAGIPFVVTNTSVNCEYDAYVGSDHKLSGKLQAEVVAKELGGKGNVYILLGELANQATPDRTEGNKEVFAGTEIKVVDEQAANWERSIAMNKVENWINTGKQIDAILANNDEMALGAIMAAEQSGLKVGKGGLLIAGIDAITDALTAVKEGKMICTVFQDGFNQGYVGVETCVRILNGEKVDKYIDVPYKTVTIDNVDEYLK